MNYDQRDKNEASMRLNQIKAMKGNPKGKHKPFKYSFSDVADALDISIHTLYKKTSVTELKKLSLKELIEFERYKLFVKQ